MDVFLWSRKAQMWHVDIYLSLEKISFFSLISQMLPLNWCTLSRVLLVLFKKNENENRFPKMLSKQKNISLLCCFRYWESRLKSCCHSQFMHAFFYSAILSKRISLLSTIKGNAIKKFLPNFLNWTWQLCLIQNK